MTLGVKLARVPAAEKPALYALFDEYLGELIQFREKPVGPTCAAEDEYLPLYWSQAGRHPFTIERAGQTAGFVLVRQTEAQGQPVAQMSEFYVRPAHRREGVASDAIERLWREFPGRWELQVHMRNAAAMAFWPVVIARHAAAPPTRSELDEADGRRIEYRFRIPEPG